MTEFTRRIGVIGALDGEVREIATNLTNRQTRTIGAVDFIIGKLQTREELEVVVCVSGMGLINAGATTQILCSHFEVESVIFSGIAGNLNSELKINDIVIGKELFLLDADNEFIADGRPELTFFQSDPHLVRLVHKVAVSTIANAGLPDVQVKEGVILSSNRFIGRDQHPGVLAQARALTSTPPDAVEMEGAAIAQVCVKNETPFVIIRALSDNCDLEFATPTEATNFDLVKYARNAAHLTLAILKLL